MDVSSSNVSTAAKEENRGEDEEKVILYLHAGDDASIPNFGPLWITVVADPWHSATVLAVACVAQLALVNDNS